MIEQFFDTEGPAKIHVHGGQVIHAVGVGDPLAWCEILTNFFSTAMQVTNVWFDLGNNFTVSAQYQSQYAVRAGMLGSHVNQHFIGANIEFDDALIVLYVCGHLLLSLPVG